MKARCYYCNEELTEKTIEKHVKSCVEMKRFINEKCFDDKKQRNQFILSIKPKYEVNEYCLYLSISGMLGLVNIDKFIRDVWVECCDHLSGFKIRNSYYQDNEMNIQLNDILNKHEKFEYEYDFGNTTHLILEVVDIIQVPNGFSQMEIIARNNLVIHTCEICGKETNNFNKEQFIWECMDCNNNSMFVESKYCNSPRDGICNYVGYKEMENMYFPGNNNKYKSSENIIMKQDYSEKVSNYEEYILKGISNMEFEFEESSNKSIKNPFSNGVYSFNIKELISNLSKEQIYDIARYLGMTKISVLNKSDLIDKFVGEYELLIERKMYSFDEERYKILIKYSNNNGVKILKNVEEDLEKIGYFFKSGMLFATNKDGVSTIVMPQIIQKLVKEKNNLQYRNTIKVNSEIINLYRGMNNAYGLLKLNDLKDLFIRYSIIETEKYNIVTILKNAEDYYREYEVKGIFFINSHVDNWRELLSEIEVDGEYSIISKEELLSMANENRIYKSEVGKTLIREFLTMFDMEEYILEGLIESLYLEIQENDLEEVINEILEQLDGEDKEVEEFMCNSVGRFLRKVRIWKYKGDTIDNRKDSITLYEKQKNIGRNDNCLCGSGKKYKNCCARNGNVINLF